MMVLNEFFYYLLMATAIMAVLVSAFGVLGNLRTPKRVNGGGHYTQWGELSPEQQVEREQDRKTGLRSASVVFLIAASFLIWALLSGEVASHNSEAARIEEQDRQDRINGLVEYTQRAFIEPLDYDTAEHLLEEGGDVSFTLVLPDGREESVPFTRSDQWLSFEWLVPADEEAADRLNSEGWKPDASAQRVWATKARLLPELEERYGLDLTDAQVDELAVPGSEPVALTQYGSTRMTSSLGDGTYFSGMVTLIWDGEFKLIGSEGTDRAAELTRP